MMDKNLGGGVTVGANNTITSFNNADEDVNCKQTIEAHSPKNYLDKLTHTAV